MAVYFTSDTHFFHKNIIKFSDRPYDTVWMMHLALMQNWNERVTPEDEIYHLGDLSFGSSEATIKILESLNGRKHLILGNHDKKVNKLRDHFETIQQYKEIYVGEQKICLFHYPITSWNKAHRGSWNLHGHCHFSLPEDKHARRMDVGVDNPRCKYAPFSMEQIGNYMDKIIPKPVDHHHGEE